MSFGSELIFAAAAATDLRVIVVDPQEDFDRRDRRLWRSVDACRRYQSSQFKVSRLETQSLLRPIKTKEVQRVLTVGEKKKSKAARSSDTVHTTNLVYPLLPDQ